MNAFYDDLLRRRERERALLEDACKGLANVLDERTLHTVAAAVIAERERCAKLAETFGNAPPNPNGRRARLAAEIRKGPTQ